MAASLSHNHAADQQGPAEVTRTVTGQGVVTNASGGVTSWLDQSGSVGNDANQFNEVNAPLLVDGAVNGLPALRFDGVDDSCAAPAFLETGKLPEPGEFTPRFC